MELELRSVEVQGTHEVGWRAPGGGRALHPRGQGVGPSLLILSPIFLLIPKLISVKFLVIPRTFISAQK